MPPLCSTCDYRRTLSSKAAQCRHPRIGCLAWFIPRDKAPKWCPLLFKNKYKGFLEIPAILYQLPGLLWEHLVYKLKEK